MSRKLLLRGGKLVDPAAGRSGRFGVLLSDGLGRFARHGKISY